MKKLSLRLQNKEDREVKSIETKTPYIRHHTTQQQLSTVVPACFLDSEAEKWDTRLMKYSVLKGQLSSGDTANEMSINHGCLLLVIYLNSSVERPSCHVTEKDLRSAAAMNQALILNAYLSFFCCMGCTQI